MRAAVTTAVHEPLAVVELDDPVPGPGEVVVSVEACGICGSDLHLHDALDVAGLTMGHEFCGHVVGVGEGVDGWDEGARAVGLSLATCGRCEACRAGRVRKCALARMVGVERPGAYAEQVVLPAHDLVPLPAGFPSELGALVEPLAVARHAVARAGDVRGEHVLVLGAGPVGVAVALWSAHLGAASVAVSDPAPERRRRSLSLGADVAVDPSAGPLGPQLADAVGAPPGVVLECVGVPGLIDAGCDAAAVDGRVVVVGVCFGADTINPLTAMTKELDVRYAFYYSRADVDDTVAALDDGRLDAAPLVTGEVDLDGLPARFSALKRPGDDIKVLVRP